MSTRYTVGIAVAALALAGPLSAQERAFEIGVHSGGFNGMTSLNSAATADFKKVGYHVGGDVGVHLNKYWAVKAEFTFARNEMTANTVATGTDLDRYFYSIAVLGKYPTASGIEPFAFVGGGGVTLHEVGTSGLNETRPAGTVGLGLNYTVPNSKIGIYLEGIGWLYEMKNMAGTLAPYDKTQFEIGWCAGLSYSIPF